MSTRTIAGALIVGFAAPVLAFGAPSVATDVQSAGPVVAQQEAASAGSTDSAAPTDPRRCDEYNGTSRSCGGRT
ncbi:hypothetical protein [Nocardiopsis sp. FIRDI 009]|uniref:hypothetical protein n=1 Tax=Nocardiopsis sp. FIRDI 009 TaxID=714197 RepID=UPI000E23DA14|nr:hypothetical protein [Nocardiopsis sp. FIRDI 009]